MQNPEKDLISQPPVLNTETLQKDVILQPSVLNTETPEKDVILQPSALNTETPLKENITSPVIEQLRIPETTVVEMQAPAPDVSVTLPKPITNNEITVSPAEQLQSPTQDIISPPPVVNIRTDNPAINIPQTDVKNEIAPLVVNMPSSNPKIISPESLAIEQSTPQNEIRPVWQNDISMPSTETLSRRDPLPMDNVLVSITRDILGEMIRQTDILEILKPQEISDIAIGGIPAYDMPAMPEIVVDDYKTSPVISSPQSIQNMEMKVIFQFTLSIRRVLYLPVLC